MSDSSEANTITFRRKQAIQGQHDTKERQCNELGNASDGANLGTVILKTSKEVVVLLDKIMPLH